MRRYCLTLLLAVLLPLSGHADGLDPARDAMADGRPDEAQRWLADYLKSQPDTIEATRLYAMTLAVQDELVRADARLTALVDTAPFNADVLLSAAQVAHWRGQDARALAYLAQAQDQAPEYDDLYRLELQILARAASTREDRQEYALRYQALAADLPGATSDLPSTLVAPRGQGWAEAGLFGSFLTGDLENALGQYLAGSWTEVNGRTWYGELNHASRFGLSDIELFGGVYQPVRGSHLLHLNASFSPTGRVRPDYSFYAGWYLSPRRDWGLEPGVRLTQYELDNALTYSLMIERYVNRWRFAYTPAWVRLDADNQALSHSLQLTRSYGSYNFVTLGASTGRDLERTPNQVVVTRVNGIGINGMHFFRPRLAVTYRLGANQLVDRYDRYDWRIGVRYTY